SVPAQFRRLQVQDTIAEMNDSWISAVGTHRGRPIPLKSFVILHQKGVRALRNPIPLSSFAIRCFACVSEMSASSDTLGIDVWRQLRQIWRTFGGSVIECRTSSRDPFRWR